MVARIVISSTASYGKANDNTKFNADHLIKWLIPRKYHIVKELPWNAKDKVVKNDVKKVFVEDYAAEQQAQNYQLIC